MLEYDKIDVSKEIDVIKTDGLRECNICCYWKFRDLNFKFHPEVCTGCHNLMQKAMTFDFTIAIFKRNDYRSNFLYMYMGKDEAIDLSGNAGLVEKKNGTL